MMDYVLIILVGYLLGGVPSGLFVGRYFCNIDIRDFGSKNIGSTNMFRTLGPKPALIVLLADMLKGILAVGFALYINASEYALLLGGIMAIIGHNYPLFLGFKGGRGVATGLGVILVLVPKVTIIVFLVWLIIVLLTRYVSLGSIIAAFLVPILSWYFNYPTTFIGFGIIAAVFVILRHKENIKRLLSGNENKIKAGSMSQFKK